MKNASLVLSLVVTALACSSVAPPAHGQQRQIDVSPTSMWIMESASSHRWNVAGLAIKDEPLIVSVLLDYDQDVTTLIPVSIVEEMKFDTDGDGILESYRAKIELDLSMFPLPQGAALSVRVQAEDAAGQPVVDLDTLQVKGHIFLGTDPWFFDPQGSESVLRAMFKLHEVPLDFVYYWTVQLDGVDVTASVGVNDLLRGVFPGDQGSGLRDEHRTLELDAADLGPLSSGSTVTLSVMGASSSTGTSSVSTSFTVGEPPPCTQAEIDAICDFLSAIGASQSGPNQPPTVSGGSKETIRGAACDLADAVGPSGGFAPFTKKGTITCNNMQINVDISVGQSGGTGGGPGGTACAGSDQPKNTIVIAIGGNATSSGSSPNTTGGSGNADGGSGSTVIGVGGKGAGSGSGGAGSADSKGPGGSGWGLGGQGGPNKGKGGQGNTTLGTDLNPPFGDSDGSATAGGGPGGDPGPGAEGGNGGGADGKMPNGSDGAKSSKGGKGGPGVHGSGACANTDAAAGESSASDGRSIENTPS